MVAQKIHVKVKFINFEGGYLMQKPSSKKKLFIILFCVSSFLSGFIAGAFPVEDKGRAVFIENCMKTGKTEELCIDNFHGFPKGESTGQEIQ